MPLPSFSAPGIGSGPSPQEVNERIFKDISRLPDFVTVIPEFRTARLDAAFQAIVKLRSAVERREGNADNATELVPLHPLYQERTFLRLRLDKDLLTAEYIRGNDVIDTGVSQLRDAAAEQLVLAERQQERLELSIAEANKLTAKARWQKKEHQHQLRSNEFYANSIALAQATAARELELAASLSASRNQRSAWYQAHPPFVTATERQDAMNRIAQLDNVIAIQEKARASLFLSEISHEIGMIERGELLIASPAPQVESTFEDGQYTLLASRPVVSEEHVRALELQEERTGIHAHRSSSGSEAFTSDFIYMWRGGNHLYGSGVLAEMKARFETPSIPGVDAASLGKIIGVREATGAGLSEDLLYGSPLFRDPADETAHAGLSSSRELSRQPTRSSLTASRTQVDQSLPDKNVGPTFGVA